MCQHLLAERASLVCTWNMLHCHMIYRLEDIVLLVFQKQSVHLSALESEYIVPTARGHFTHKFLSSQKPYRSPLGIRSI